MSQIWPSAVKPTIWSPPRWIRATTSAPVHESGIDPRNRNHVVSHMPPQASPTSNGVNGRLTASMAGIGSPLQVVGRHLQRSTPPVDRRADHRLQELPERAESVSHRPKSGSRDGAVIVRPLP